VLDAIDALGLPLFVVLSNSKAWMSRSAKDFLSCRQTSFTNVLSAK
jgi:hypothetical protein